MIHSYTLAIESRRVKAGHYLLNNNMCHVKMEVFSRGEKAVNVTPRLRYNRRYRGRHT